MARAENWPKRLNDAVDAARSKPFEWGTHDCCLMAADMIYAITADDPAASFRGTYSTEAEAAELIASHGSLKKLVQSIATPRGWISTKPALARRGDLVMFTSPVTNQPALGICLGRDSVFPSASGGLGFVNTTECSAAWRVE